MRIGAEVLEVVRTTLDLCGAYGINDWKKGFRKWCRIAYIMVGDL